MLLIVVDGHLPRYIVNMAVDFRDSFNFCQTTVFHRSRIACLRNGSTVQSSHFTLDAWRYLSQPHLTWGAERSAHALQTTPCISCVLPQRYQKHKVEAQAMGIVAFRFASPHLYRIISPPLPTKKQAPSALATSHCQPGAQKARYSRNLSDQTQNKANKPKARARGRKNWEVAPPDKFNNNTPKLRDSSDTTGQRGSAWTAANLVAPI